MKTKTFVHKLTGSYKITFNLVGLFQKEHLDENLDESDIDLDINKWLENNSGIEIIEIKQSTSKSSWIRPIPYVTTSIWYRNKNIIG